MKKSSLFLFFALESFVFRVWSQCPANFPTALPSTTCTGTPLPNGGTTINNGETYFYSANNVGSPFNGVTIADGGTLRICGRLELNSLTMNSGTGAKLIIEAGGRLTVLSSANLNGGNLTNYGQLTFNGSSTTISNNLYSAVGGTLTFTGATTRVAGNLFVGGSATTNSFQINTNGRICLGPAATLATNTLIINSANSVSVASGNACIRVNDNGNSIVTDSLTKSSALKLCLGTGVTESGTQFGSATILRNCVSCQVALPVELAYAAARQQGQTVRVSWVTASERNSAYFVVEKATSTFEFGGVSERITARGTNEGRTEYIWTDSHAVPGWNYYRLRQVDLDGTTVYSRPMSVAFRPERTTVSVTPNPAEGNFRVRVANSDEEVVYLKVSTLAGRNLWSETVPQGPFSERLIDLQKQPNGLYLLHVGNKDDWQRIKLIKVGH